MLEEVGRTFVVMILLLLPLMTNSFPLPSTCALETKNTVRQRIYNDLALQTSQLYITQQFVGSAIDHRKKPLKLLAT